MKKIKIEGKRQFDGEIQELFKSIDGFLNSSKANTKRLITPKKEK